MIYLLVDPLLRNPQVPFLELKLNNNNNNN